MKTGKAMRSGTSCTDLLFHPISLTLYRIAAIPAIILFLVFTNKLSMLLAAILFSAAAITDFLDGFFARRRGLVSNVGKFMDPLADKLLNVSAFIMLTYHQLVPGWVVCIIVGREFAVTGLRAIASEKGIVIAAAPLGKYKTGFQIAAIIPLLINYSYLGIDFHAVGMFFIWIALVLTIISGGAYFVGFFRLMR